MARMNSIKFRKLRHQARLIVADVGATLFLKAQDYKCPICQQTLKSKDITVDHVFPLHNWKKNAGNLLLCHHQCNQDKGERLPTEFEINMLTAVNDALGYDQENDRYRCRHVLVNKYYKVALWYDELLYRNASQAELDKVQLKLMALEEHVGRWIDK